MHGVECTYCADQRLEPGLIIWKLCKCKTKQKETKKYAKAYITAIIVGLDETSSPKTIPFEVVSMARNRRREYHSPHAKTTREIY